MCALVQQSILVQESAFCCIARMVSLCIRVFDAEAKHLALRFSINALMWRGSARMCRVMLDCSRVVSTEALRGLCAMIAFICRTMLIARGLCIASPATLVMFV